MAIDPNDLLIFEVREEIGKKPAKKAKAVATVQAAEHAQAGTAKVPEEVLQAAKAQPQEVQNKAEAEAQPAPIYQKPMPSIEQEQMFVVPEPSEMEVEAGISIATDRAIASEMVSKKGRSRKSRSEEESKEAAHGLYCVWHPWRPAYAVCAYCHRPFCFEDIVESNGNYYCLEDIDKVVGAPPQSVYVKYNNLGLVSAGALLAAFIVALYYGGAEIVNMVKLSNAIGILAFTSELSGPYGFVLLSAFLAIFMFIAAMMIFMQMRRSFAVGLAVSFISLAAFSYEYLSTAVAYEAVVSIASFIGLVLLLYSRSAYEGETEEEQFKEPMEEPGHIYPSNVPNIGRF